MAEIKRIPSAGMTPDSIMNALFKMDSTAEYYHLQTDSFAQHKMLDELHGAIEDHKDSICEYLLGMQAPKKFGSLSQNYDEMFSVTTLDKFLDEGIAFAIKLSEYGNSKGMRQLANMANELEGTFAKGKYLNTLK